MKRKLLLFLLLGVMVMTLAGCEGEGPRYRRIIGALNDAVEDILEEEWVDNSYPDFNVNKIQLKLDGYTIIMVGNDHFSNAPSVIEYVPQTVNDIIYEEDTFWNDVIGYVLVYDDESSGYYEVGVNYGYETIEGMSRPYPQFEGLTTVQTNTQSTLTTAFGIIIPIVILICILLFQKKTINENGILTKMLGRSDEEKYINLLQIRKTRKKIAIILAIIYLIMLGILLYGINTGAVGANILDIILFIILLWFFTILLYGNGLAWFFYLINSNNYNLPETEDIKEQNERIINAYFVGGRNMATIEAVSSYSCDFISIILGIAIGVWLGLWNALFHFKECRYLNKKMKEKYKVK